MRQVIMTAPGEIKYQDVAKPETLKEDEVLLKIEKIGICGSDIHVFHGEHPATPYPVVQGHEYSASVAAVGSAVQDIKPGMKATGRPQLVCGTCASCLRGSYNVCKNLKVQGFQAPGVGQDYFVIPQDRVVVIPDDISFDEGAMIEPTAVAAHATRRPETLTGKNVVVSGAGTIGNLIAQFAKARGAKKVLVTDLSDFRLDIARQCGIEGVNISKENFKEKVDSFFEGEGFQVGFEAVGVQGSLDNLLEFIEKGSEIVIVGVFAENPRVNMFYLGEHELKLIGSLMYLHQDYLEAVDAILSKKVLLQPMITDHFPFEQFPEAYQHIADRKDACMKVIIDMN